MISYHAWLEKAGSLELQHMNMQNTVIVTPLPLVETSTDVDFKGPEWNKYGQS